MIVFVLVSTAVSVMTLTDWREIWALYWHRSSHM